ncbi:Bromodomain-containing protein [Poronia punctata]|nr:Bromodomain-containing protein [Poronia punctata]
MARMASEEPQSLPLEAKKPDPTPNEAMEIDRPVEDVAEEEPVKVTDGITKPAGAPATNGDTPNSAQKSDEVDGTTEAQTTITINGKVPASSQDQTPDAPPTDDIGTKQVNGTSKTEEAPVEEKVDEPNSAQQGKSEESPKADKVEAEAEVSLEEQVAAPEDAPEDAPANDSKSPPGPDPMDIDVSAEQPDLDPSADVENTQKTSTSSEAPVVPSSDSQPADLSTLEIKATQEAGDVSPKQVDTPMGDVDPSPGKVSRAREEDDVEEPSAKRAKTEDANEAVADSLVVASNPTSSGTGPSATPAAPAGPAGTQADTDGLDGAIPDSLPIIPFQNRKLREVLGNVKKTKNGGNFKKSVEELWPTLWNDYRAKVDTPVDISMMEAKLREDKYANYGEFKGDVHQLYKNAVIFNGPQHDVSLAAAQVRDYILVRMPEIISSKPPAKPDKGKAQPTRHAEPRAMAQPRQPQTPAQASAMPPKPKTDAPSAATPGSATAQAFAIPPSGIPQIRRDSTRDDNDRPKRPIHPPKNRDPEYSKASLKKKLGPEQRFFGWVLEEVKKTKYYLINQWFLAPVDPVALNIPNYFGVIKKPMDLQTMTEKNARGEYKSVRDVDKDMKLIVHNSDIFNGHDHEVTRQAKQLQDLLKEQLALKDSWMERHYPAAAPSAVHASAASPDHSNDESDEESEGDGNEEDNDAIQSLQQRLNEEQDKLNKLLNSKKPDLTMMEVQQSMVTMLQRKLVEEKTKHHSGKKPKAKKKHVPKNKSKAGGGGGLGGGNKRSSGASNAFKKPSSSVKKAPPPKKRVVGALEKAVIAEGINDLDGTTLTRAVEIIKRDTGQAENDDGEMELDIDILTTDALSKLFDLINKTHPHILQAVTRRPEHAGGALTPETEAKSKAGGLAPKPKKNKPMNKQEQERRIEQLRELKAQLQRGDSASQEPTTNEQEELQGGETSEESDSEEE